MNKQKDLITIRLFSPLTAFLYISDEYSSSSDWPDELNPAELCAYEDEILEMIQKERLASEGDRGLAVYLRNAAIKEKVYSMKPTVENWKDELWGVLEVKSYGRLTEMEQKALINEWCAQESDGWGESFEQRAIETEDGKLYVSFWNPSKYFFIKPEQELKAWLNYDITLRMGRMQMQVTVIAKEHNRRDYKGAVVELPASSFELEDAFQRAHIPEGGGYRLQYFNQWPVFLLNYLTSSDNKTLEEVNLLAKKISQMNEIELATYEGALRLRRNADIDTPISIKELINYTYNLDVFEFHPEVLDYRELGEIAIICGMLDTIKDLPEEIVSLLDEQKVGDALRRADQGAFTTLGYIFRSSSNWQEVYDGVHLPEQPEEHGLISLKLKSVNSNMDTASDVWLELPADEKAVQGVLTSLGENSLDYCTIVEAKSVLLSLKYRITKDADIDMLNLLAKQLEEFPDSKTMMKYKAALELEHFPDIGRMLDIAQNLDCYDYDPSISTAADFAEILFREAGFDTDDPAFSQFDFFGYGERQYEKNEFVATPYGTITRNNIPFITHYSNSQLPTMT